MSFEKVDVDEFFQADEQNAKILQNMSIDVDHNKVQTRQALLNAYAEIDRLTAAFHASEATLKDCHAENDRLTAMLDELRGNQAEPAKPEWTPPKSLKDGVYSVGGGTLRNAKITMTYAWARAAFADFSVPSVEGRWRITDGKAEYLGP